MRVLVHILVFLTQSLGRATQVEREERERRHCSLAPCLYCCHGGWRHSADRRTFLAHMECAVGVWNPSLDLCGVE